MGLNGTSCSDATDEETPEKDVKDGAEEQRFELWPHALGFVTGRVRLPVNGLCRLEDDPDQDSHHQAGQPHEQQAPTPGKPSQRNRQQRHGDDLAHGTSRVSNTNCQAAPVVNQARNRRRHDVHAGQGDTNAAHQPIADHVKSRIWKSCKAHEAKSH